MTEGPRTVAASARVTEREVLAQYEAMGQALQRLAAITRFHGNETAHLSHSAGSAQEVITAWRHAFDLLEESVMSAKWAHQAILASAPAVAGALRATEASN